MPLFSSSNLFDIDVEKVTSETNTSEDWSLILDICDRVCRTANGPKDCLRAIMKRVNHRIPHVSMQALTLLDACVNNCGQIFHLEMCTRQFSQEIRLVVVKSPTAVSNKLKELLQKWAYMLKDDPKATLIPTLCNSMKNEGIEFPTFTPDSVPGGATSTSPVDITSTTSNKSATTGGSGSNNTDKFMIQEDEDLAKAIEMSLRDLGKSGTTTSSQPPNTATSTHVFNPPATIYPVLNSNTVKKEIEKRKVRALYDFEAVEDNELTFMAGDIITVTDDSDPNWWKGETANGSGLFPSNFVTPDLSEPVPTLQVSSKNVESKDEGKLEPSKTQEQSENTANQLSRSEYSEIQVDEEKIDYTLEVFGKADVTINVDTQELIDLEDMCNRMKHLVSKKLERLESKENEVNMLKNQFEESLAFYQKLMKERPRYSSIYAAYTSAGLQPDMSQYHYQPNRMQDEPLGMPVQQPPSNLMYQQQQPLPQNFTSQEQQPYPARQGINQPSPQSQQQNVYNPINQSTGSPNELPMQQSQYYQQQPSAVDNPGSYYLQGGQPQQQTSPQMNQQQAPYTMYQPSNQYNPAASYSQPPILQ